jgi:hypothetical protein
MDEQLYYIWSFEHDAWWAPKENGYIEDWHGAGKYTLKQALEICQGANRSFHGGYAEMPNEAMVPVKD